METITIGTGSLGKVVFADPGSREDDLGGGTIYAALVKSSTLRALGQLLGNVETLVHGEGSLDLTQGAQGAIIADSSDITDIPMQFVAPETFVSGVAERLGGALAGATVEEFFTAAIAQAAAEPVEAWDTFAQWLEVGTAYGSYREMINGCIGENTGITFTPISGSAVSGDISPMPQLTCIGDLFGWLLACMPASLKSADVSVITSPTVATKLGFSAVVSPLAGGMSWWIGDSVTIRVWFRL